MTRSLTPASRLPRPGTDEGGMRWRADDRGRAVWLSDAWLALRGRAASDELGERWREAVHPDDLAARDAAHALALATQTPRRVEFRLRAADDRERWLLEEVIPVAADGAHPRGLAGVALDVTDIREREATLTRERDRLASILSAVPGVVWEAWGEPDSASQRIDYVSEHVEALLGYAREEWLATPAFWLTIVHPEDRDKAARRASEIFQSGKPGVNQFRWITKDGRVLDVRAHGMPMLDAAGRPIGMRGVTIDISDRVVAEMSLREERDFHEALLGAQSDLGEGVVVGNRARVHYANDAFCRLVGHDLVELRAMAPEALLARDAGGRPRLTELTRTSGAQRYEAVLLRKDGAEREVEVLTKLLPESRRFVAIVRDAAERKRDLEELEVARRQVAQSEKLSVLGSLVSGLAHEIRTPLAYLDNHVSIVETRLSRALKQDPIPATALQDLPGHLAAAHEGVDRINRLVKDLRRFIKMEAGPRRLAPLDEVVADAQRLFEAAHRGRARIRARLQPTGAIPLDAAQVQQVVINLLDNAADATSGNAPLQLATRAVPGGAELVVADRGIGIPPEVVVRMYDPFFSTKAEGTGLGLAIVRRIVESHGGTIRCTSDVGRGTTFTVFFPASED